MYWIGLIIVSVIWALGSMEMTNPWLKYGGAMGVGMLYWACFHQYV